jgi:hypothetical protein
LVAGVVATGDIGDASCPLPEGRRPLCVRIGARFGREDDAGRGGLSLIRDLAGLAGLVVELDDGVRRGALPWVEVEGCDG